MYVCMYVRRMDGWMDGWMDACACMHAFMYICKTYIYIVIIQCLCFATNNIINPCNFVCEPSINPPERFQHGKCAVVSRRESMHQHFLAHTDF